MNYSIALVQLPLIREASGEIVRKPEDAARVCADMQNLAQEALHILTLDTKNHLINRHLVTLGLINSSQSHPREFYRPAILDGACSVLAIHNHCSGDSAPSSEDINITKQLIEAGKIIGIPLLDHVIIGRPAEGRSGFFSMRESGMCDFSR